MPTLINVPTNDSFDESTTTRSQNVTASMTDIKTLLQGIDFSDSFASQDEESFCCSRNGSVNQLLVEKSKVKHASSSCDENGDVEQNSQHKNDYNNAESNDKSMDRTEIEIEKHCDPDITTVEDDESFNGKPESSNKTDGYLSSFRSKAGTDAREHHSTRNSISYQSNKENVAVVNQHSSDLLHKKVNSHTKTFASEETKGLDYDFRDSLIGNNHGERIFGLQFDESSSKSTFMKSYDKQVSETIRVFKKHNENILVDYGSLSSAEKTNYIENVNRLLERIVVTKGKDQSKISSYCVDSQGPHHSESFSKSSLGGQQTSYASKSSDHRCQSPKDSISNYNCDRSECISDHVSSFQNSFDCVSSIDANNTTEIHETSMALLTPTKSLLQSRGSSQKSENASYEGKGHGSRKFRKSVECYSSSSSSSSIEELSVESIEETRRCKESSLSPEVFATPESTIQLSHKRCASRSGKRGVDLTRSRLSDDCFPVNHGEILLSDGDSLSSRNRMQYSPPPGDEIIFTASQSPIQHNETGVVCSSFDVGGDAAVDLNLSNNASTLKSEMIESIQTSRGVNERHVRWQLANHDSFLQEAPANISMKDPADFRMNSLVVQKMRSKKNRSRIPFPSFPDPLEKYNGSKGQKLNNVYKWMKEHDQAFSTATEKGGVLFSVALSQAKDLALKIALEAGISENRENEISDDRLRGRTILVCRSKADLEVISCTFREGSAFSVLNHATQPLAERTRATFSSKCATFDVVLSTYDALMSKDVAIAVNEDGHATTQENGGSSWYSSRSNENDPITVDTLSTLHLLQWDRVIFLDELGRKSYLAKFGTIRGKAAIALNAMSRFACFGPGSAKEKNPWEGLRKSDKRAFQSVAAVLRMKEDGDDDSIFCNSIDLKTATKL